MHQQTDQPLYPAGCAFVKGFVLAIACFLTGCTAGSNVASASADYPVPNAAPVRKVTLIGEAPTELSLSFLALWVADRGISGCEYYANVYLRMGGPSFPYSITVPLPAERVGKRVVVPVLLDKFLPGRCNWTLAKIQMNVTDGRAIPQAMDMYYDGHGATSSSDADILCRLRIVAANDQRVFCAFSMSQDRGGPMPTSLALRPDNLATVFRLRYSP